jgi:hypothetical protein
MAEKTMRGCDGLRKWLIKQGFTCYLGYLNRENDCNWSAYRKTEYPARECETNEGKAMQIVIHPFSYSEGTQRWEIAEIEVIGEVKGLWFNLRAYSVPIDELKARLQEIEIRLLDAWNALAPYDKKGEL